MNIKEIKKMKTSELIDNYEEITDEQSIPFMDEFWNRFPFEIISYDKEETEKMYKRLSDRINQLEQLTKIESRILTRIDRLTLVLEKLSKKK
jgi:hypothetical protein